MTQRGIQSATSELLAGACVTEEQYVSFERGR
jgi:hypothetical protein